MSAVRRMHGVRSVIRTGRRCLVELDGIVVGLPIAGEEVDPPLLLADRGRNGQFAPSEEQASKIKSPECLLYITAKEGAVAAAPRGGLRPSVAIYITRTGPWTERPLPEVVRVAYPLTYVPQEGLILWIVITPSSSPALTIGIAKTLVLLGGRWG